MSEALLIVFKELVRNFSSDFQQKVHIALNLSVAYSSSIGGSATLIGSGAPLLLKGLMER